MDWDKDPELKLLREEFIDSFSGRLDEWEKIRQTIDVNPNQESIRSARIVVHRIAGAAATYDFPQLSDLTGILDSFLTDMDERIIFERFSDWGGILSEVLKKMVKTRQDVAIPLEDERWKRVISLLDIERANS